MIVLDHVKRWVNSVVWGKLVFTTVYKHDLKFRIKYENTLMRFATELFRSSL